MNKNITRAIVATSALVVLSGTLGNGAFLGVLKAFGYGGSDGGAGQINQFAYTPVPSATPVATATPAVTAAPSVSPTPSRTPVVIRRTPSVSPAPVISNGVTASSTPAASVSTSVSPSPSTTSNGGQEATIGKNIFSSFWSWIKSIF